MRNLKKIISLFIATTILATGITLPVSSATPDTILYLFHDTMDSYESGLSVTGSEYGASNSLIDGIWETSADLGGTGSLNSYGTYKKSYIGNDTVLGLAPSTRAGGSQCVLNLVKGVEYAEDYTYSVDMKMTSNLAGIRLADTRNDTTYYELALTTDDSGSQARFSKVDDALYDTPSYPEEFLYVDYSNSTEISQNHWLTLSLSKKDDTFYWSVSDKTTGQALFDGSYTDTSPLFMSTGRLQLFSCCVSRNADVTFFDNVHAKKLGSVLYMVENDTKNDTKIEVSWINISDSAPIIATADYDENGRVLAVETFDNIILDKNIYKGEIGYFCCDVPFDSSVVEKKLFVWDSQTMQPLFDTSRCTSTLLTQYDVPANYYVRQFNRGIPSFSNGGGILLSTGEIVDVSPDAKLYVNGYEYTSQEISDKVLDKFLGNSLFTISFRKSKPSLPQYDIIYVNYCIIGTVHSVSYANNKTTIKFSPIADDANSPELNITSPVTIIISDYAMENGTSYIYAERNNVQVSPNEICKDDIIAVAIDNNDLVNSVDYTITDPAHMGLYATNKTVRGMVVDYDDEYGTYTIGEKTYKYVGFNFNTSQRELFVATTYIIRLDPFDRLTSAFDAVTTGAKFAIVERTSSSGEEKVNLLLEDGSSASYEIGRRGNLNSKAAVDAFLYPNGTSNPKAPVQDRVVTYRIASDDTVTLNTIDSSSRVDLINKEYNPNTGKLGSVAITDEVKMINAADYVSRVDEYSKFDASELVSGVPYTAYAYRTGDIYTFVLLTSTGPTFSEDSRFAVITKNPSYKIYDGATCMGAEVLYKGEQVTLYWDTNATPTHTDGTIIAEGDVMFFTTDAEGYVSDSYKIYDRQTKVFANTIPASEIDPNDWRNGFADGTEDIQLVSGVVADVRSNSITFGVVNNGEIDGNIYEDRSGTTGMYTFGIADDCNAYVFDDIDGSRFDYRKYSVTDASYILESVLVEKLDANQQAIDYLYDAEASILHNAVAMVVDGDVVAIFVNYPAV